MTPFRCELAWPTAFQAMRRLLTSSGKISVTANVAITCLNWVARKSFRDHRGRLVLRAMFLRISSITVNRAAYPR
jgi:hypothetical protein